MNIKPIKKVAVTEEVFEQLKSMLISGAWKQGDKIPSENELALSFGVSRVSVRQALSKLTTLGLLRTRLGEGTFVKEINPGVYINSIIPYMYLNKESTKEVFEFRLVTEVEATGIAATRISDMDILSLERSLSRMKENKDNLKEYIDEDLHFHMIIAKSTNNSLIIQINNIVREIIKETMRHATEKLGSNIGLKYHALLIDAFKRREPEAAKEIMREHLIMVLETYY